MKSASLILGFLISVADAAPTWKFSARVVPHVLLQELQAAGFNIRPDNGSIQCTERAQLPWDCEIQWGKGGETRDPSAVIKAHRYRDVREERRKACDRVRKLAERLKAGTLTPKERDELLDLFVLTYLGV